MEKWAKIRKFKKLKYAYKKCSIVTHLINQAKMSWCEGSIVRWNYWSYCDERVVFSFDPISVLLFSFPFMKLMKGPKYKNLIDKFWELKRCRSLKIIYNKK